MNLSLVEKVSYFFDSLGIVYDVQGPGADIQPPLEMAVHWVSFIQHLKHRGIRVRSWRENQSEKTERGKINHPILNGPRRQSKKSHLLNYFPISSRLHTFYDP